MSVLLVKEGIQLFNRKISNRISIILQIKDVCLKSKNHDHFIPVRALSNYVYCPRLFYYQYVENIFIENADTAKGSFVHRNVDKPTHWKEDMDLSSHSKVRSISLESKKLRLRGVVDLIEDTESGFEIIDYKKGSPYRDEKGFLIPKEMDAIQCAAYVLLLREQNIFINQASIYYVAEKKRVPVLLSESLFQKTFQYLKECKKNSLFLYMSKSFSG